MDSTWKHDSLEYFDGKVSHEICVFATGIMQYSGILVPLCTVSINVVDSSATRIKKTVKTRLLQQPQQWRMDTTGGQTNAHTE